MTNQKLINQLKLWLETHNPSDDTAWHLQNFLGDYLGWGSDEQKEFSELLKQTKE